MAGETVITVVGNLVEDPELRFTPSGAAVAAFRIASTPSRFNKDTSKWEDGDSLFLRCSVWRQAAENAASRRQQEDSTKQQQEQGPGASRITVHATAANAPCSWMQWRGAHVARRRGTHLLQSADPIQAATASPFRRGQRGESSAWREAPCAKLRGDLGW